LEGHQHFEALDRQVLKKPLLPLLLFVEFYPLGEGSELLPDEGVRCCQFRAEFDLLLLICVAPPLLVEMVRFYEVPSGSEVLQLDGRLLLLGHIDTPPGKYLVLDEEGILSHLLANALPLVVVEDQR